MSSQSSPGLTPSHRALANFKKLSLVIFVTKMLKGLKYAPTEKEQKLEKTENVLKAGETDEDKEKREKYLAFYDAFWSKPNVRKELEAYAKADDDFKYEILQGFIPKPLVGKVTTGYGPPWKPSDTFFTDFKAHYPNERILHATDKSLIICNHACHDVRLYDKDIDPTGTDRTVAAGMSYMHLLVIPVARVYNAVALEDSECVEEMSDHFKTFWRDPDSKEKIIAAIDGTMDRRYKEIVTAYDKAEASAETSNATEGQNNTSEERRKHLEDVMVQCRQYASQCAHLLRKMHQEYDDYMGFHPHPSTSVGHLHMHVLFMDRPAFRTNSTSAHDSKTIPASVVLKVINEKRNTSDKNLIPHPVALSSTASSPPAHLVFQQADHR